MVPVGRRVPRKRRWWRRRRRRAKELAVKVGKEEGIEGKRDSKQIEVEVKRRRRWCRHTVEKVLNSMRRRRTRTL